jgi:hypothetical protein
MDDVDSIAWNLCCSGERNNPPRPDMAAFFRIFAANRKRLSMQQFMIEPEDGHHSSADRRRAT